jgi:hypothetical protein
LSRVAVGCFAAAVVLGLAAATVAAQEHSAAPAAPAKAAAQEHSAAPAKTAPVARAPQQSTAKAGVAKAGVTKDRAPAASHIEEAETTRGHVDGSIVEPAKPQVAKSAPPRRPEHAHADSAVGPKAIEAVANEAGAKKAGAPRAVTPKAAVKQAGAKQAVVQELSAKASAAEVADRVAAALRAAALRPPVIARRGAGPAGAAPNVSRGPSYTVTWPSRPIPLRWPEAPDRIEVAWPDQQPPAVRLRWEPVPPRP